MGIIEIRALGETTYERQSVFPELFFLEVN